MTRQTLARDCRRVAGALARAARRTRGDQLVVIVVVVVMFVVGIVGLSLTEIVPGVG